MAGRFEDIQMEDLDQPDDDDDIFDDEDYIYDDIYDDDITEGDIAETSFSTGRLPDPPLHNPSDIPGENIGNLRYKVAADKLAEVKKKPGK
ncbi:hypothetical protein RRG08_026941 [Elysia crispata]|uniref:Uncharacterized protein n=1 Tax=Elysia crispata TaxID=231223 RepID=A0AAE0YQT1_9GAST|nr:hypothetical protein RRG08_026941 [Elysia crispata]